MFNEMESVKIMKIYNYDEKHKKILGELNLGNLSAESLDVLQKVICFLQDQEVFNEYNYVVMADSHSIYHDEDGTSFMIWEDVQ